LKTAGPTRNPDASTVEDSGAGSETRWRTVPALFHHDPNHADDQLESLCERVRELWTGGSVDLAREGDEIDFG
jgi:hypothetical protein